MLHESSRKLSTKGTENLPLVHVCARSSWWWLLRSGSSMFRLKIPFKHVCCLAGLLVILFRQFHVWVKPICTFVYIRPRAEIKHCCDWLKRVTWLATSNQSSVCTGYPLLKLVYGIGTKSRPSKRLNVWSGFGLHDFRRCNPSIFQFTLSLKLGPTIFAL